MTIVKKPNFFIKHRKTLHEMSAVTVAISIAFLSYPSEMFQWLPDALRAWLDTLATSSWYFIFWRSMLVVASIVWVVSLEALAVKIFRSAKENWEWADFFIDEACNKAYKSKIESPMPNEHRVTLYKYFRVLPKKYRHWSMDGKKWAHNDFKKDTGWLVPIMRAKHENEHCCNLTVFAASRDNKNFEGIAGKAWATKGSLVIKDLPEVTSSNSNNRKVYADNSYCSRNQVDFMLSDASQGSVKKLPRTIGAITLVDHAGINWGVLVFDSKDPQAFPDNINNAVELNEWFKVITKGLGNALGGKYE